MGCGQPVQYSNVCSICLKTSPCRTGPVKSSGVSGSVGASSFPSRRSGGDHTPGEPSSGRPPTAYAALVSAPTNEPSGEHDRSDHPSVARVLDVLRSHGHTPEIRHLPDAVRTAAAAAEALGITPAEIANSLVFAADPADGSPATPLLVLSSGGHKVDLVKIAEALDLPPLRRATPEEVRSWTGFAIGGVAPVGHLQQPRTVVDVSLARFAVVWAAAGHSHSVFATTYADLITLTGGTPLEVV